MACISSWLIIFPAGDARNEVMTTTELAKLKFDPRYYKINAYQGLAYDPMREFLNQIHYHIISEFTTYTY